MEKKILSVVLEQLASFVGSGGRVKCIWHGGEPLLLNIDFYYSIIELQKNIKDVTFTNGLQCNGTLLTDRFIEFALNNLWGIGISLDGPKKFHDTNRVTHNGRGSWGKVNSAMKRYGAYLAKSGAMRLGVICSVTEALSHHPHETYAVFREQPVILKLHPVLSTKQGLTPTAKSYGLFLLKFLSDWLEDDDTVLQISTFDEAICSAAGFNPRECTWAICQKEIVAIDMNGDIYPCNRAIGIKTLLLGNIIKEPLDIIINKNQNYYFKNYQPNKCRECGYWNRCHGGCPMHSFEIGTNLRSFDPFCLSYKMLFDWTKNLLKNEINVY